MSDASRQNLKVSREGIVLIKSFEGFRPRAVRDADGGWVIGYGHTLSAREGAAVSEADAELLLRYDLLPVEKSVNDTVPGDLNQHQFDALVSFAFSVGVDRFASSDVRQRLNAGAPGEAADAMMGWPEPALPETALRRRAAERALFVANPSTPVALSDLLSAPLPPPAIVAPDEPKVEAPEVEQPRLETPPVVEPVVEPPLEAKPEAVPVEDAAPVDPRGAAVAALLGEPPARLVEPEGPHEILIEPTPSPEAEAAPTPFNDNPPAEAETIEDVRPATIEILPSPSEPVEPETVPTDEDAVVVEATEKTATDEPAAEEPAPSEAADDDVPTDAAPTTPAPVVWAANRYTPYSSVMVGPLPYLQAAEPKDDVTVAETPAIDHAVVETALPTPEPTQALEAEAPSVETTPVEPMAYVAPVAPAPAAELVLTPLEDAPEPAVARPLWTPEERDAPDGSETNLFGEDLALTQGGSSIMRHEIEMEAPVRFDWKETAPFIFMGGVGLVSFGASMAAFRRAAETSSGGELTIIGWVLALIGLACVGISSINLYRRFGLPGGD